MSDKMMEDSETKHQLEQKLHEYENEQKQIYIKSEHTKEDVERLNALKKQIEWYKAQIDFYDKKINNISFNQCANNPYCLSFD